MRSKGESLETVFNFISSSTLFSNLSKAFTLSLARGCKVKVVDMGVVLFFQSDPSEAAYIVRKVMVSIIINSPDGREMVINEMQKGNLFGELLRELLTSQPGIKNEPALA